MSGTENYPSIEVDGEVKFSEPENDWSDTPPSTAVIKAIASIKGTDPVDLKESEGIVLYDYINPDALNDFVTTGHENNVAIAFSIDDYTICIEGSKLVVALIKSDSSPE